MCSMRLNFAALRGLFLTEFVDLMPELCAAADKRQDLSPHELARQFVVAEGQAREGVESIIVTDSQGKFIGAGTQNLPAGVHFPTALQERLRDPKANLVLHHNHPPSEEPFLSDTDIRKQVEAILAWRANVPPEDRF